MKGSNYLMDSCSSRLSICLASSLSGIIVEANQRALSISASDVNPPQSDVSDIKQNADTHTHTHTHTQKLRGT